MSDNRGCGRTGFVLNLILLLFLLAMGGVWANGPCSVIFDPWFFLSYRSDPSPRVFPFSLLTVVITLFTVPCRRSRTFNLPTVNSSVRFPLGPQASPLNPVFWTRHYHDAVIMFSRKIIPALAMRAPTRPTVSEVQGLYYSKTSAGIR